MAKQGYLEINKCRVVVLSISVHPKILQKKRLWSSFNFYSRKKSLSHFMSANAR